MNTPVIVLNADYSFLSTTSWQNAICLLYEGKAEPVEQTEKVVRNSDRTVEIVVPLMIRIIKYIRKRFKQKVPYSKRHVFVRDEQTCQFCGTYIENINDCTVDHVIPKAQGGKSTWTNAVTACKSCNHRKADRTPSQARMYLKRQPVRPTIGEYLQYCTKKYNIQERLSELLK
jgi:5-methylcytosine-specific restriction endonuclease McrA